MKTLILLFVFIFAVIAARGQRQHGSGGAPTAPGTSTPPNGAAATPASSGSGSTQLIQGFHYRLRRKFHIKYKQVIKGAYAGVRAGNPPPPIPVNVTDRFISFTPSARTPNDPATPPAGVRYIPKNNKVSNIIIDTHPGSNTPNAREDTRDTLSRYNDGVLWVSVTQGDSGKLAVQFLNKFGQVQQQVPEEEEFHQFDISKIDIVAYKGGLFDAAIPINEKDSASNFYFQVKPKLTVKDPLYYISLPYYVWQYGATTIPFRYRFPNSKKSITLTDNTKTPPTPTSYPVPSESTANISLAAYLGYKFGGTRFYYDATKSHNTASAMISVFGGPTLVSLTANNMSAGSNLNNYPSSILTWSTGVSLTFEFGAVNLGLFGGIDIPFQNTPWVYANKPWIGFGIGFNLGMLTSAGNIGLANQ